MERDDIIKALREEIEAIDSADGKGVATKEPKEMKTPSDATKTEKVKLDGGGKTVGGEGGGVEKGGKAAEGADKPAIEKADGKSVASAKVGEAKVTGGTNGKAIEKADGKSVASATTGKAKFGGGTDGKAMEKADGKGVAASTVKASPDLKGDNTVGESITLPHDVLVEMDGKKTTLKAGTRVMVVKEEEECKDEKKEEKKEEDKKVEEAKEECEDEKNEEKKEKKEEKVEESKVVKEDELPSFLKDDEGGEVAAGGEEAPADPMGGDIGGEDLPGEGGAFEMPPPKGSEMIGGSALDKIVASLDTLADGFREFAKEEQGEEAHDGEKGGEGGEIELELEDGEEEDEVAEEKEDGEDKEDAFAVKLESISKKGKLIK